MYWMHVYIYIGVLYMYKCVFDLYTYIYKCVFCICMFIYIHMCVYIIIIFCSDAHAHSFAYIICICSCAVRLFRKTPIRSSNKSVAPGVLSYVFCAALGSPEGAVRDFFSPLFLRQKVSTEYQEHST